MALINTLIICTSALFDLINRIIDTKNHKNCYSYIYYLFIQSPNHDLASASDNQCLVYVSLYIIHYFQLDIKTYL